MTVVWLILIISREHVHMATIPFGCIFSILKHIEHKVCNANNTASKQADSKHTKKQAPSLRGTIINMLACARDKKIIRHLPYLL